MNNRLITNTLLIAIILLGVNNQLFAATPGSQGQIPINESGDRGTKKSLASPTSGAPASNQKPVVLQVVTQPFEKTAKTHEVYFFQLLELALKKTEATDGPFSIAPYKENFTNKRYISEVMRDDGLLDVIWTMNDKKREQELLPIKISVLRGLNSFRVFLIRKGDQEKFHNVHSLKDLAQYNAGLGSIWPDTPIMQSNGLPVITSAHYELLFTMLAAKRFDYFPRGLYEVWDEQRAHPEQDFIIEDSLMLHYPAPIYFFVNKKNVLLANRIERGLRIAMQDGSFDQLFFSIPGFKWGFEEMHNSSRQQLDLATDSQDQD
jgi:hypothetical protein